VKDTAGFPVFLFEEISRYWSCMFDKDFFEYLGKKNAMARQRSTYFKSTSGRSDRQLEELMVVDELLRALCPNPWNVEKLELGDDPPDVIGKTGDANLIAFEVTELVNEQANRLEAGMHAPRKKNAPVDFSEEMKLLEEELNWNEKNICEQLEAIIKKKNKKLEETKATYPKVILVVHSDETNIYQEHVIKKLMTRITLEPKNIDEVWLVRAPDSPDSHDNVFRII
jgi:hypothetical protein